MHKTHTNNCVLGFSIIFNSINCFGHPKAGEPLAWLSKNNSDGSYTLRANGQSEKQPEEESRTGGIYRQVRGWSGGGAQSPSLSGTEIQQKMKIK